MSGDVKSRIAERAADELRPGEVVTSASASPHSRLLGAGTEVVIHTENGLPASGAASPWLDPDLVGARAAGDGPQRRLLTAPSRSP